MSKCPHVVPLDPAQDPESEAEAPGSECLLPPQHPEWIYPALAADPGFRLIPSASGGWLTIRPITPARPKPGK